MADEPLVAPGFGERVSRLRDEKRLTQKELAERVGVEHKAVSAWETGERLPRDTTVLIRLAAVLECSLDYLLLDVEGDHEFTVRRLRELLSDLLERRRVIVATPSQPPTRAAHGVPAPAPDVVPDHRLSRRRRRGA